MKAVRTAIAAIGNRDSAVIERATPPRARHRRQHVMMVRGFAHKAFVGAKIVMFGRVSVPGQADRIWATRDELQEVASVDGVGGRIARIEIGPQRNMHADDDQFFRRDLLEQIADEGQLPLGDAAFKLAASSWLRWVEAE